METNLKNSKLILTGKTITPLPSMSKSAMIRVKADLGGRLPSFKPPRDLSLSGPSSTINSLKNLANTLSSNKKVFAPNVNVARRKAQSVLATNDAKTNKDIKPNLERGRRGPKPKGNYIQTQGVFSEGLSKAEPKEHGSRKEVTPTTQLERPKLNLKRNTNKKQEDIKMNELLKDDFIQDSTILPDFHDQPMSMPLLINKKKRSYDSLEATFESLQFKTEKMEEHFDEKYGSAHDILQSFEGSSSSKLLVFEFPDEFRDAILFEEEPKELNQAKLIKQEKGVKQEKGCKATEMETVNPQRLANLGEGRWGTLKILKNGNAYIAVGNERIPVEISRNCAKQNVISVDLNSSASRASIINLGCVESSFVCSSDLGSPSIK